MHYCQFLKKLNLRKTNFGANEMQSFCKILKNLIKLMIIDLSSIVHCYLLYR